VLTLESGPARRVRPGEPLVAAANWSWKLENG